MGCCSGWVFFAVFAVIAWWLIASAIVYFTWNRVITEVTSAKSMHYVHALWLVFAITILFAPHHAQNCWRSCNSMIEMDGQQETLKLIPQQ
ncbi:MAG: hypothetical protein WCK49_06740 [Myxococcaceae bacterium]